MTKPGNLDILVCTAKEQDEWRRSLSSLMPEANLHVGLDAPPCDYAIVWKPPAQLFGVQTRLKAIFSLGAGVNGLLDMPSLPRHVPLVRMEDGGMSGQMIEYAMYVALRQLRRFADYERDRASRTWNPRAARARGDLRIGVLGLGTLGRQVAQALAGFGFSVSGWSRTHKTLDDVRCEHGNDGLDRVLAHSELILVFLPLTDSTLRLLDRERLQKLPRGACVVNLSRGEVLDDTALLALLDSGHLAEAHLDVFEQEPLPADHPYWRHPRVRMTPHVAALTDHLTAAEQVARKIRQLEEGQAITGVVDFDRQY